MQVYKSSNDTLVDADILGNKYTDTDAQQIGCVCVCVHVCVCVCGGGGGDGGQIIITNRTQWLTYIYNCLVAVHAENLQHVNEKKKSSVHLHDSKEDLYL